MSSTLNRRYKRQKERDIKKGKIEEHLRIPTEKDVQEYINNKSKELSIENSFSKIKTN